LNAWRDLSARYHYTAASENGYTVLYSYILEKYKQEMLEPARKEDSSSYFVKSYLGDNFDEIDTALLSFWQNGTKNIRRKKRDKNLSSSLEYLLENGKITVNEKSRTNARVPRRKASLKNRLRFNPTLYKLSLVFFKKNSKIRARLKNKL
jgi:hypothetical protein